MKTEHIGRRNILKNQDLQKVYAPEPSEKGIYNTNKFNCGARNGHAVDLSPSGEYLKAMTEVTAKTAQRTSKFNI